jgi:ribokinase
VAVSETIAVLGSANLDLVVQVGRHPEAGETLAGTSFRTVPGGKGLNQAVAAARAGARVRFLGAVGTDDFGDLLLATLAAEGIDSSGVQRVGEPSGTAHIRVAADGQNSIVVVAGANATVTADQLVGADAPLPGWLVTQLELPLDTVAAALSWARAAGVRTVLTPAPARQLPAGLLAAVDLLVPNELEAGQLAGVDDPLGAAAELSRLCGDVVVTLGAEGAAWARGGRVIGRVPAVAVTAVDTTAAGDTFVGVLVALLAEGLDLPDALGPASHAAALAVSRLGSTTSMPTRAEIDAAGATSGSFPGSSPQVR